MTLLAATMGVFYPLPGDQQVFSYAAVELLRGARPGIELWEVKPPLHLYLFALFFKTFGIHEYSTILGDFLFQFFCASIFTWGLSRRIGAFYAILTSVLYLFTYYAICVYADRVQVEGITNGFFLASLGLVLLDHPLAWLFSGFFTATGGLTKFLQLIFIIPLLALNEATKRPGNSKTRRILIFSGFFLGIFFWLTLWGIHGSLRGIWTDVMLSKAVHGGGSLAPLTDAAPLIFYYLITCFPINIILMFFCSFLIDWHSVKTESSAKFDPIWFLSFLMFWFLAAAFTLSIQHKWHVYHYLHFMPLDRKSTRLNSSH